MCTTFLANLTSDKVFCNCSKMMHKVMKEADDQELDIQSVTVAIKHDCKEDPLCYNRTGVSEVVFQNCDGGHLLEIYGC